ncbi:methyltransferase domain-containing protein [Nocardioides sp. ChNu-153]|uniref:methyltransferase domain-containing protein n=1 Tax=unclassified Nocardioides TaxID=2615069 RepID=UPI002406A098|nr:MULTISPECIES: methyltransferase domain-containing protein [unclassified Nocardioides]MDF9717799.1 methyltransferase domain-containing protein [Nocardioides sp. ChNu-99]MDN7120883.1 methyltransferase domain-containing protein [Nocardioides sp. ChNu-153]
MAADWSVGERAGERRAAARTAVVQDALDPLLAEGDLTVVDIGGGTGGFAVRIAERGHRVTVVDPSPDALASLDRRAREAGVDHLVTAQQGDVDDLASLVPPGSVDLVLCHGVLEVVGDPADALEAISSSLRPGGHLSLLVAQRFAAVVARAMAGHFAAARDLLDSRAPQGRAGRRFTLAEVETALAGAGLHVETVQGVRVFADLVPGSLVDAEPGSAQALVELERAVATREELRPLATQLHLLARR